MNYSVARPTSPHALIWSSAPSGMLHWADGVDGYRYQIVDDPNDDAGVIRGRWLKHDDMAGEPAMEDVEVHTFPSVAAAKAAAQAHQDNHYRENAIVRSLPNASSFTPTPKQLEAATAVLVARAYEQSIRPIVEGYQRQILQQHQFHVSEKYRDKDDRVILDPKDSWLMSEADFAVYDQACQAAQAAHGLRASEPWNCPLLEANHLRRQRECDLLQAWDGSSHGLTVERRHRAVELTLNLLTKFLPDTGEAMRASDVKTNASVQGAEPSSDEPIAGCAP